jgi:signal transduction histidine kinase
VFLQWRNGLGSEVAVRAAPMRQIILNLVLNACQATPRDSLVRVSINECDDSVMLEVEDEGPGMPPEARAMLTGSAALQAPIGKGTGLGLWMTNRLVRELNGEVRIASGKRGGTCIVVSVPLSRKMELGNVA